MSRHRNFIHEDDFDDYDDYDEYDDEEYYGVNKRPAAVSAASKQQKKSSTPAASNNKVGGAVKGSVTSCTGAVKPTTTATTIATSTIAKKSTGGISVASKISVQSKAATSSLPQLSSDMDALGFHDILMKSTHSSEPAMPVVDMETSLQPFSVSFPTSLDVRGMNDQDQDKISDDDIDLNFNKDGNLPHLSLIVVGHVDSGKSTLVGHLLYKRGNVSQRTVHKFERESQASGKGSFYLAWIMDESESEREHGVTIDVAQRNFSTTSKQFTILDSPGHRDFLPNMISGCSAADVALLVVPASAGEFETCMMQNAQTREHATILKSMGVNQILVAVNKMDITSPPWNEDRFREIEYAVRKLLLELNFGSKAIRFVPLSGLTGENIVDRSAKVEASLSWYKGGTLLDALEEFKVPPRILDKPLRAVITSVIGTDSRGVEVNLSILQGRIRNKRNISIVSSESALVKSISMNGVSCEWLFAGQQGTVQLTSRKGSANELYVSKGMVISKGNPLLKASTTLKATIVTMATLEVPIIPGSSFELYIHGEEVLCTVSKIYTMVVTRANEESTTVVRPKCVGGGRQATVKISTERPVCVEPFELCKALGRFALRSRGKTCAVGIVSK